MTTRSPRSSDFPALRDFVRGYLHEDFPEEHGSAVDAAAAFCADAGPDERSELAQEIEALVTFAERLPIRDVQRFITRDLGSRWKPRSIDEIVELLDAVR